MATRETGSSSRVTVEMKACCQLEHRLVLGKDVRDDAAEFLAAGHLDQPTNQLRSEPCTLGNDL